MQLDRRFRSIPEYPHLVSYEHAVEKIIQVLKPEVPSIQTEDALLEIETEVTRRMENLKSIAPFRISHSADMALARLSYIVCRALKPRIVVETGVAYGVTTAYLLKAMDVNRSGTLHSIDLPPLGKQADAYVGYLIPEDLKSRWVLHRGSVSRVMPGLLRELRQVDMFIHDSLHTYHTMFWEFSNVTPYLSAKSALIADDIGENDAFNQWSEKQQPSLVLIVRKLNSNLPIGFALHSH